MVAQTWIEQSGAKATNVVTCVVKATTPGRVYFNGGA
jgi:hypothetical protein